MANLGAIGSSPMIFLGGQAQTTVSGSTSLIGGGYTVGVTAAAGTDFAAYNTTYGVGALGSTGFAGYSPLLINNAASTDNVSMATGTGVAIGIQSINSLRVTSTAAINQTAGSTLTLASGGLLTSGALTLGSVTNQGNLTSGGAELFLLGTTSSTLNSAVTGSGVSLVKSGSNTYTLNGTNTYTGGAYVDQGTLTLGNGGNVTLGQSTLGTGGIFLNGGSLTQTAGSIINPAATVSALGVVTQATPAQAVTITGSSTLTTVSDLVTATTSVTTFGSNTITVPNGVLGVNGIHIGDLVSGTGIPGNEFVTAVNPATNTVTITSGNGVLNGAAVALTFRNLANSISSLTFNNDGGSSPTLTNTGLLNITSGTITASSNNVGGVSTASVSTLTGGNVDLGNVASPTITVNPIAFNGQNVAPYQPTLIISSALQNASNQILVTGGGNLQVSGLSTFTGGVNLAAGTSLTIGVSSTNNGQGLPINGPLGQGTLTVGAGNTLYTTGSFTVGNNIVLSGSTTFDLPSTAAATLTLGVGAQTIALPAGVATIITVNNPAMTTVFNDSVTGSGSTLVKAGLGNLQLNNSLGSASTFSGGVVLNAGTLTVTGIGATASSLGNGPVILNGGVLSLLHSGQASNGQIGFANAVDIVDTASSAYININNNGANTGNTILMGALDYGTLSGTTFTSNVAGNAAPSTVLNVTGGSGYKLQFTSTTLTGATSSPTFNIATGLSLVLPGGFTVGTNLPTNIGPGSLIYSGTNGGAASAISGTTAVTIGAAQSSQPLGSGTLTLNNGSTLQLTPFYTSSVSSTGYTNGTGLSGKDYYVANSTLGTATNWGIAPGATLLGVQANDSFMRQGAAGIVGPTQGTAPATSPGQTIYVYQGLLNIATGGAYYFGGSSDDAQQVVIDGQLVQNQGVAQDFAFAPITLSSGTHLITIREDGFTSGNTASVYYSGPDTAGNGVTGLTAGANNYQALSLSKTSYAVGFTAANNYQNAAILNNALSVAVGGSSTVDGLGTDLNYAVPSLTLGGGSTLTVANGTGLAVGSIGNGTFIVAGLTTLSGAINTVNPTTGTLVLAGGVTDGGIGLNKTGAGNLILAGGGVFTGPLNINAGFVQLQDGGGLTTGTTTIGVAASTPATLDLNGVALTQVANLILNGGAGPAGRSSNAPAGLYNSSANTGSFFTGSTLVLGAATTAVNASVGGFGNIDLTNVAISGVAANQLDKVSPDTVIFGNSNSFVGQLNIKAGIAQIAGANGFSSDVTNPVLETSGATIDLNGQTETVAKPLTLAGAGLTGLGIPNQLGALINSSATAATYSGPVTLSAATSIGGPSVQSGVNGSITLSGALTGAQTLTKVGGDSLILNNAADSITAVTINAGSVTINGAGKLALTGNTTLGAGATLAIDNSSSAVSGRLFTGTSGGLVFSGNFTFTGNSGAAVAESITNGANNLNPGGAGQGGVIVTLNSATTGGVTLSVATTSTAIFNRVNAGTGLLRGDNLGILLSGSANASNIVGNATSLGLGQTGNQSVGQTGVWNAPNALIYPWAVADNSATGVGTGFAGYNGYTTALPSAGGAVAGTAGNVQGNVFGVSSTANDANNALSTKPVLTALNINTTNASATVTTASTAGLSVGQYIVGTGIAGVITAITNSTTFTVSANATATANNTAEIYANGGNSTTTFTGVTPAASTTITVSSTANLYAGEVVAGVTAAGVSSGAIPTNGTTIASITNGTTIVLSNTAAAVSGNLVFGLNGLANISSSTGQSFGTATAAQEQNSLTLTGGGAGGFTTTLSGGGLVLLSGGTLAVGSATAGTVNNYTIAGSSMLTSTAALTGENVIHVTGVSTGVGTTNTTLTISAPIFSNGGGLTKADGGTLVLGAAEPYTGNTTLNGGVTQLAVGQNTIFMPFTTAPTAGNANASVSGQVLYVNFGATLDINGATQAVANLASGSGTDLAGGTIINNNVSTAGTLHVALNGNQTWAGNLSNAGAGTLNFVRDGNNTLTVDSPNTLGGSVTISGGATKLNDLGTFQNASAINVTRSALIWDNTGTNAVSNRLGSNSLTLSGGGLPVP